MSSRFQPNDGANLRAKDAPLPESLDDAIAVAVHGGSLPAKALADSIGVRYGYLLDAANPHRDDTQFQARLIVPLTRASGSDAIVRFLAVAVGGVFVRVPEGMQADAHTARSLREFSEYLESVAAAGSDKVITRAEVADIRRQATEAIEAVMAHVKAIELQAVDITPMSGRRRA